MYDLEVIGLTSREISHLEVIQNRVGRIAHGANRYVAVEALKGEMGWSRFRERIALAKTSLSA